MKFRKITPKEWEDFRLDEAYLVDAIKTYLLTKAQHKKLLDMNLSVEDLLNGRFTGAQEPAVYAMFKARNATLGWPEFSLAGGVTDTKRVE